MVEEETASNDIMVIVKSLRKVGIFIASENSKITDVSKIKWP